MDNKIDARGALTLFGKYMRPYALQCVVLFICIFLNMWASTAVPTILSGIIDSFAADGIQAADNLAIDGPFFNLLVSVALFTIGSIGLVYFAAWIAAKIVRDLRVDIYKKSLEFSASDFEKFGAAALVTRTLSDMNMVEQAFISFSNTLAPVPILIIIMIYQSYSANIGMGNYLLVVTLLFIALTAAALLYASPVNARLQAYVDRMNTRLRDTVTGIRVIRVFGRMKKAHSDLDASFETYADSAIKVQLISTSVCHITFLVSEIAGFVGLWFGFNAVGASELKIGSVSMIVSFVATSSSYVMGTQLGIFLIPRAMACLNRSEEILSLKPSIENASHVAALTKDASGILEVAALDSVTLRFKGNTNDTLKSISFALNRGSTTAIIGPTGAGKTTIAKLLMRFCDPTTGSVTFMGHNITELDQVQLRSHISYVPQQSWLFSGTIADNLRYAKPDATEPEMWKALESAKAGFVKDKPEGLDTPVSEGGSNFSGGQRQRLTIARALVRKADLYIFDDSFSALDARTDVALRGSLEGELGDAAVLIIAQRLSTIKNADQIIVLDEGNILGIGTHDELMQTCEAYQAIAASQERKDA